jgi:hypothetical protein
MGWLTKDRLWPWWPWWLKGQHYGQPPISSLDMFRCILWYSNMDSGEIHKKKLRLFCRKINEIKVGFPLAMFD